MDMNRTEDLQEDKNLTEDLQEDMNRMGDMARDSPVVMATDKRLIFNPQSNSLISILCYVIPIKLWFEIIVILFLNRKKSKNFITILPIKINNLETSLQNTFKTKK